MDEPQLSRRERQIMDIIYAHGQASASQVLAAMGDPPSRASVRKLLAILEAKGHVRHVKQGREFCYSPIRPAHKAAQSALNRVLSTFFAGSVEKALALHLSSRRNEISAAELERLAELIHQARQKGR